MTRKVGSSKPRQIADNWLRDKSQTRNYPVDVPLHAEFEADTGVLVIETPVFEIGKGTRPMLLRLHFSAAAACGFLRVVNALEEAGYPVGQEPAALRVQ